MIRNSKAIDSDMFVFLGDNVEDSMQNARYYTTFGLLDDVSRLWGRSKPSIFLRGNHDSWGHESYLYGAYFPRPDGKSYFAVRQGPLLLICFDYYGGLNGNSLGNQQIGAYLKEQIEWYRALQNTPEWKTAKFRIAMAHVGTHACEGHETETTEIGKAWKKVLNDPAPEKRIHAFLCGHEHTYRRIDPFGKETKGSTAIVRYIGKFVSDFNYTLVVGHLTEGMTLDVTPEKLTFRSYCWNEGSGSLNDAFEIMPDGKVKDLMKVKSFPLIWNDGTKK